MGTFNPELMYELQAKDFNQTEALKPIADHAVKEIKSAAGWDTDVQVHVEPQAKDKGLYSVSISVFGLGEPVIAKKEGKNVIAVFRKVRKSVLRRIHQMSDQRIAARRRTTFREQFAS